MMGGPVQVDGQPQAHVPIVRYEESRNACIRGRIWPDSDSAAIGGTHERV